MDYDALMSHNRLEAYAEALDREFEAHIAQDEEHDTDDEELVI